MDSEQRGHEAQRILDSFVVKETLQELKQEIIEQWSATPARDTEAREWLWRHYMVAAKFEGVLKAYADAGRFESANKENVVSKIAKNLRRVIS